MYFLKAIINSYSRWTFGFGILAQNNPDEKID